MNRAQKVSMFGNWTVLAPAKPYLLRSGLPRTEITPENARMLTVKTIADDVVVILKVNWMSERICLSRKARSLFINAPSKSEMSSWGWHDNRCHRVN